MKWDILKVPLLNVKETTLATPKSTSVHQSSYMLFKETVLHLLCAAAALTMLAEPFVIPGAVPRAGILVTMEKGTVLVVTFTYTVAYQPTSSEASTTEHN